MENIISWYSSIAFLWALAAYEDGEKIEDAIKEGIFFPYEILKKIF